MAGCMVEDRYPRITFDSLKRMKFHPSFHLNQGKTYTTEELEYLCRFYEFDHMRTIAFALGRTEATVASKVDLLRQEGMFEYYKRSWNRKFESWKG
ncbi:DNA-entry nuclease [Brevibacillus laterosporus]|uniref:DNA-entry nuclease n=1 Tax=Brevibacillus laterosporus TaxID=1465 RepID=UPI0014447012|nr:DNA-entry nuclease [Brevibacillus laterosporus]NKQ20638.1 DNA-entry nuclease [Brevibacillus laterosporus]WNX29753.1 DNA-entry nuclease [Brevibacillus laterosporus]